MSKNYKKYSKEELITHVLELEKQLKNTKYGLYWDKNIDEEKAYIDLKTNIPVLKRINHIKVGDDIDLKDNIAIEGDNLHSLTMLNTIFSDKKKIDVIYIDPPYNTGHGDNVFSYNDRLINKDDGFIHSRWLTSISKRLQLLRDLLDEKGVIFISIDDNELYNLKLLCDSIFRSKNFIGNIVQDKCNAQNDAIDIQKNHDYCLVYCKNRFFQKKSANKKEIPHIYDWNDKEIECFKEGNKFYYIGSSITTGGQGGTLKARNNLGYSIYYNQVSKDAVAVDDYDHNKIMLTDKESEIYKDDKKLIAKGYSVIIRPPRKKGMLGAWTWDLNHFNKEKDKFYFKRTKNGYSVHKKIYVDKVDVKKAKSKFYLNKTMRVGLNSIQTYSSGAGSRILLNVLGYQKFKNPKNVDFIKFLIGSFPNKNAIVLDAYAGSGTTAQAVIEMNKEDGGNRRFIICGNNENNNFIDSTLPRIKTILTGIRPDKSIYGKETESQLLYYKTDFIKRSNNIEESKYRLAKKVDELLCITNSIYNPVFRNDFYSHYRNESKTIDMFIYFDYFDKTKFKKFYEDAKKIKNKKIIYIFSNDAKFSNSLSKLSNVELKTIPENIYNIYCDIVNSLK